MNERAHDEQSTDNLEDERSSALAEALEEPEEAAPAPVIRPRARRASAPVQVTIFGGIPASATMWALQRATLSGTWDACGHPDGSVVRHEWPLSDLSDSVVSERWGAGTYRVQWFKHADNGGRKFLCCSAPITVLAKPAPAAAAAAPSEPSALSDLAQALQVMDLIDRRSDMKIAGMANLAKALGGARTDSLSGEDLVRVMREERAHTTTMLTEAISALNAKVDAIGARASGDDGGGVIGQAAKAAGGLVDGGTLGSLMSFAKDNPDLAQTIVEKGLPMIQGAVLGVLSLFKPPAPPVQRPRAQLAAVPNVQPTAEPEPRAAAVDGGLSSWVPSPPAARPAG